MIKFAVDILVSHPHMVHMDQALDKMQPLLDQLHTQTGFKIVLMKSTKRDLTDVCINPGSETQDLS